MKTEKQIPTIESQLGRIADALEDIVYVLQEVKGTQTVTNRMHEDTQANVLSEIAYVLNKKFEEDFNTHLNK